MSELFQRAVDSALQILEFLNWTVYYFFPQLQVIGVFFALAWIPPVVVLLVLLMLDSRNQPAHDA